MGWINHKRLWCAIIGYYTPTIFLLIGHAIPCKKSKFCLTAKLNISENLKIWLSLKLNARDKSAKRNVIILKKIAKEFLIVALVVFKKSPPRIEKN